MQAGWTGRLHSSSAVPHQHTPIKVLYLAPQAGGGTAIAAQSFIEEEIRTIAEWGVIPYVLSSETSEQTTRDGIHVVGARHDHSATSVRTASCRMSPCRARWWCSEATPIPTSTEGFLPSDVLTDISCIG
jgi:hypothetical protein